MRKVLVVLLWLSLLCRLNATTPVTGSLKDLSTGAVQKNAKVRLWLRGCGGNQPRVLGSALVAPVQGTTYFKEFLPDASGNITGTVYATRDSAGTGNGEVDCGGSKLAVWYGVQVFVNGVGGPEVPVHAKNGISLDLTSAVPISSTPVVTAPTGDSTYARLDAANTPFTGAIILNSGTFNGTFGGNPTLSGNVAVGGTLGVGGTSTLGNVSLGIANTLGVNNIKQQAGAAFVLSDPLGPSHIFISSSSPYTNTFINGNGAGVVFLGSAAKTSVADTTGNIVTAGSIALQTTSQTLPATVANDTAGGIALRDNATHLWQFDNATGILFDTGNGFGYRGATSGISIVRANAVAGASNVLTLPATTDTLVGKATTDTLTNKRVTPRVIALGSSTAVNPDADNGDISTMNMTGVSGTLTINAPAGTPTEGQKHIIRLKATNSQTYSFNATYAFSATVVAPTTLAAGKTDYIGIIWDAVNTKWDVVAVDQGH